MISDNGGTTGKYQYGDPSIGVGYDNRITGYTGESVTGTLFGYPSGTTQVCISGTISLGGLMASPAGCGPNAASYNEHPGYDYQAANNTPVYAAYSGYVFSGPFGTCVLTPTKTGSCASWGMVGIDHSFVLSQNPQPYITQYEHMRNIQVSAGQYVTQGQLIGYTSNTAPPGVSLPYHFHFEVLQRKSGAPNNYSYVNYLVIDPYGWTGGYADPLYSSASFGITQTRLWQ